MAFHGCLCTECERLYGYVGTYANGKQVVCGRCEDGWRSIRNIELVLEAQKRIRDRGEEATPQNVWDEMGDILQKRRERERELSEMAELRRLERKYRRKKRH